MLRTGLEPISDTQRGGLSKGNFRIIGARQCVLLRLEALTAGKRSATNATNTKTKSDGKYETGNVYVLPYTKSRAYLPHGGHEQYFALGKPSLSLIVS